MIRQVLFPVCSAIDDGLDEGICFDHSICAPMKFIQGEISNWVKLGKRQ